MNVSLITLLVLLATVAVSSQAVYLKTNESVALPVYQVLPDQPTKIAASS